MKLNNKGFAITGILYGLLILFALLVGSYLTILTAKKNRLDGIVADIENEYNNKENISTYTLTIKKGPGVEKICYKVNNEKNFICKEGIDTISKAIKVGTNYYYYGVPSQNYTMTKCSENDKCSSSMPNHEEDLTLAAISNTSTGPFYVKIYVWDELQADGETSNGTFEAIIFSNGDTSIYCDSPAIGTVDYSGNVTVTNITKDTSCYIG